MDYGVEEVLINTHYMAPMVQEFLQHSSWRDRTKVVHEEYLYGTGGTMLKNREFFSEETFLVAHADNLTIFDFEDFARCHADRPAGTDMTMMVFGTSDPQSCGIVQLDGRGVVQAFYEKVKNPPGNLANAAVYMLEPPVLDMTASLGKEQIDFSTEVIPHFLGRMFTYRNTTYHRDIGNLGSWLTANKDFPVACASAQNQDAWALILAQNKGQLASAIDQFMADASAAGSEA